MSRKLATALVVPLLLATACAKQADDAIEIRTGDAAVIALRGAPAAVTAAGTSRFEMTMTLTGLPGAGDDAITLQASGALDAEAQQMTMEMDLAAIFEALAASTGQSIPAQMSEPARFVVDRGTAYVRMPMLDAITGASGWVSMTPEDIGQSRASLGLGAGAFDPSKMLEVLRGTAEGVEPDGQEEIRGVATTKYTATVSLADALASVPADQREELEAQLEAMGTGDAQIPVEVWVDADGLPRRFAVAMDDFAGAPTAGAGMTMQIEFFDYGEPVEIDVPSPDEVTPFGEVMGGLGGGFGEPGS